MARWFVDSLVLAAFCKEVLELARQGLTNPALFLTTVLAIPFFLGISPSEHRPSSVVVEPLRSLVRTATALFALVVYWQIQWLSGGLWQFGAVYGVMLAVYAFGRFLEFTWRAFWLLAGLLLAGLAYLHWTSGAP